MQAIALQDMGVSHQHGSMNRQMASVLGDDIITTTQSHRPYKLPNTQNVTMMVAEDKCSR